MSNTKYLGKVLQVLLVEDDPGDVLLTEESLKQGKVRVDLHHVDNGIKAIEFLRKTGQFETAIEPDLVLLDLNLPGKNGREVLSEIKSDDSLRHIPVVILTTSEADEDILKSYDLGANSYVTKPVGLAEFIKLVKSIENFWFTVVKLPSHCLKS